MQPKVILTLLTVCMCTINTPKHSSQVWVVMIEWTDKDNRIAVIALHKCRIESACIFELLKPLNINIKGKPGKVK